MSTVKKPADRQGKKPTVKTVGDETRVTFPDLLVSGEPLTVTVPKDALDDFELLEDLNAIDVEKKASRLPAVLQRLVGDQYSDVLDALRGDSGRVSITTAAEWIGELLGALDPNS